MKDLNPKIWVGLPLFSILLCLIVALFDHNLYRDYVRRSETGYLEHATVIFLVPAFVLSGWLALQYRQAGRTGLALWALLMCLGSLYFAGEESSWGQHYVGWDTPDAWSTFNDQNETNFHNTHGLLDQTPRGLLTIAAYAGICLPLLLRGPRRQWDPTTSTREWIFPTMAVLPSAILAGSVGIPQKFYGGYGEHDVNIPAWIDQMFLRGAHSELKEHFLALFILMYVTSWTQRHWTHQSSLGDASLTVRKRWRLMATVALLTVVNGMGIVHSLANRFAYPSPAESLTSDKGRVTSAQTTNDCEITTVSLEVE